MAAKRSKGTIDNDAPFEKVVERLQTVVDGLENGELSLEQSLVMFEEGVRLSRIGQQRLDDAERRVELLLQDGISTAPFEEEEDS